MINSRSERPKHLTGSCVCGAIRYTASSAPETEMVCHCDRCRPQSGSAFSTVVMLPRTALSVTGAYASFDDVGTSGKRVTCCFCPKCGSPLFTDCEALPDTMIIKAGTIHDNEWFKPSVEIFVRHRRAWVKPVPQAVQFDGNPPL